MDNHLKEIAGRLSETSAIDLSPDELSKEWKRLQVAFKSQLKIGTGKPVKKSNGWHGLATFEVAESSLTSSEFKKLVTDVGYKYEAAKTDNAYDYGYNDKMRTQFYYLASPGVFILTIY